MKESKLNPFDAELLVMIGDIAKSQPEVEEKPDRYEITVDTTEIQGNAIEALKQAVAGRLGDIQRFCPVVGKVFSGLQRVPGRRG